MKQRIGIGLSGAALLGLAACADVTQTVPQSHVAAASVQEIPATRTGPRHITIRCG